MRLDIVLVALLVAGCDTAHLDSDVESGVDRDLSEDPADGGLGLVDGSSAMLDASTTADSGLGNEPPDAGAPPIDAEVGDSGGEDAGDVSQVGMCRGELTAPATFGTAEAPIELAASESPFEGQIDWRGRAFVRITGLTSGSRYALSASARSDLVLSAFTDDATFTDAACVFGDDVDEFGSRCLVTASGTSIDVTIDAQQLAETFTLAIKPAYEPEGTPTAPAVIASAALPRELEVDAEAKSFYEITGLTPAMPYVVSARAAHEAVLLEVHALGAVLGVTDQHVGMHARAIGAPLGTSLLVALRGGGLGTAVELDIRPATRASEGTAGAPIPIAAAALPFQGDVGWSYNSSDPRAYQIPRGGGSDSFYTITGLAPGGYVVKLDGATAPVFVILDDEGGHASEQLPSYVRAEEGTPARIATRIAGSTLDLIVKNPGGDGTSFTLGLEPAARSSSGTEAAPLPIPLADFPYSGEIEPNIYSYYEATGLTPGQHYLARVTDVDEAAVGVLFIGSGPLGACEIQAQTGTSGQTCTIVATDTTARFQARVFGYTSDAVVGGVFKLSFDPIVEESVGTPEAPVAIECLSGTYTGQLGTNGESYYEIAGLSPGAAYWIEAVPHHSDIVLNVFSGGDEDPFSSSAPCVHYGTFGYPARCVSTSAAGSLFVHAIGYARGQPFDLHWRRAVTGSEGARSTPIALALTDLPYAGQVSGAQPSFYTISGLMPGAGYVARIAPVEEPLDVSLYAGPGFEAEELAGLGPVFPGEPFERTFTATSATTSLKIALPIGADGASAFTLSVTPR